MKLWKTHSRKLVLDYGKYLTVEERVVESPSGIEIDNWTWVITPEYVDVLAITINGMFICLNQCKYAINQESTTTVGGYIEDDEHALEAAKRELREETGYSSSKWISLGSYYVDGNRGCGRAHLYLALEANKIAEADSHDLEVGQVILLTRTELENKLYRGEFLALPWAATIGLALHYLDKHTQ